jgi:two-component sensor histidine kinase
MTSGFLSGALTRGLAVRMLLFLSLALLPIGLIAVVQTRDISQQQNEAARLSLIAVTEQASVAERRILQEGFGAAEALGAVVRLRHGDPGACSEFLAEYKKESPVYALVGFIPLDGPITCVSNRIGLKDGLFPGFDPEFDPNQRQALSLPGAVTDGHPTVIVTSPLHSDGELVGSMALAIAPEQFDLIEEPALQTTPLASLTLNPSGGLLAFDKFDGDQNAEKPSIAIGPYLTGKTGAVFESKNMQGEDRVYAVVPIIPGIAYALSVWPTDTPFLRNGIWTRLSALLPILMWVASLVVAFWSLHRLAINHIRKLGRQMRQFALNRNLPRQTLGTGVPTEIMDIETAFISMAESILRDEASLEDSLRGKNILLKEVHHRVKNNLQLISSIMNMQIRQAESEDAKKVLQRLQERILGLATVHKNMYQNDDLAQVEAGVMLKEIVDQLIAVGLSGGKVQVSQSYDDIILAPDDAAPLMMLVSEALTNAMKYVGAYASQTPSLSVSLVKQGPSRALLSVANTVGDVEAVESTGLGHQLMNAFARQLNGVMEVEADQKRYQIDVNFAVSRPNSESQDF